MGSEQRDRVIAGALANFARADNPGMVTLNRQEFDALAHPAPSVPDTRILDLAERLVASGPKASHVSTSECQEISEFILSLAAAPSPPVSAQAADPPPPAVQQEDTRNAMLAGRAWIEGAHYGYHAGENGKCNTFRDEIAKREKEILEARRKLRSAPPAPSAPAGGRAVPVAWQYFHPVVARWEQCSESLALGYSDRGWPTRALYTAPPAPQVDETTRVALLNATDTYEESESKFSAPKDRATLRKQVRALRNLLAALGEKEA